MTPRLLLIDVDNTLTIGTAWTAEECATAIPRQDWIDAVNRAHAKNFVVIYTARRHCLYEATIKWLDQHGVQYHAVKFGKTPGEPVDFDAINSLEELDKTAYNSK